MIIILLRFRATHISDFNCNQYWTFFEFIIYALLAKWRLIHSGSWFWFGPIPKSAGSKSACIPRDKTESFWRKFTWINKYWNFWFHCHSRKINLKNVSKQNQIDNFLRPFAFKCWRIARMAAWWLEDTCFNSLTDFSNLVKQTQKNQIRFMDCKFIY